MRVVFAGGGTGGHLYPAIALAEAVEARGGRAVMVTGNRDIENRVFSAFSFNRISLSVSGYATTGFVGRILAIVRIVPAFFRSIVLVLKESPDFVAITGGYVAFPVGMASVLLRKPLVIIEPNAIAGRVTRLLQRFADAVVTLAATVGVAGRKATIVGVPVRKRFIELQQAGSSSDRLHVLVVGGSQGAKALNDAVPAVFAQRPNVQITHVAGPGKVEALQALYNEANVDADVLEYADDIAALYGQADFVIGRAGAGTVAELFAMTMPAVLVPYPYAADNHQTANAGAFVDAGGGKVVEQGERFEERLTEAVTQLLDNSVRDNCRKALKAEAQKFDPGVVLDEVLAVI